MNSTYTGHCRSAFGLLASWRTWVCCQACLWLGVAHALVGGATAFAGTPTSTVTQELSLDRPNILVILADDLGYGDLGCTGHPHTKTPNIDALARQGTRYTQYYVHMLCSPTRVSALTGQFHSRWRIFGHLASIEDNLRRGMPDWLDSTAPSMPRMLQSVGYRTAHFGKWHLGGGSGSYKNGKLFINHPQAPPISAYGFDVARSAWGNSPTWRAALPVERTHEIYPYDEPEWQTWSSRAIGDATCEFLEQHVRSFPQQPFYAQVWLSDPHTPLRPTDEMRAPYLHLPEPQQTHSAMVSYMDSQIGRVLKRLEELKLDSNTLVVFYSDNGGVLNRGARNSPYRGEKWTLYEGGLRVPLIVRWPGHVATGKVDTDSVLNVCDWFPTLCELGGAKAPQEYVSDGENIQAALLGTGFHRTKAMYWHHPTGGARCPELAIRFGNWKLLQDPNGERRALYNLASDSAESHDVASAEPLRVKELERMLLAWYRELPIPALASKTK